MRPASSGFTDPVLDAQSIFRAVMEALARPGTILDLPARLEPPPPLTSELAAVTLALCDHETPVWLHGDLAGPLDVAAFLRFHAGIALVEDPGQAAFAIAATSDDLPPLAAFAQGSDEYPDRSTTLVLAVGSLGRGPTLRLEGPGIKGRALLRIDPSPPGLVAQLGENRSRFPRGVDCIFVAPGKVAALPRTARVSAA